MRDEDKTEDQLIGELRALRRRVAELEKDKGASIDAAELRRCAEKPVVEKQAESDRSRTKEYTENLLLELQVHQVELEMQNEDLRNAQAQLEQSRTKYSDLYEFAPVGYLTLDEKGFVLEANLTIVRRLGIEKSCLVNYPFPLYIAPGDRNVFRSHLNEVVKSQRRQSCQIGLMTKSGGDCYGFLDSIFVQDSSGKKLCRTTVTDITERRRAEEELRAAYAHVRSLIEASLDPLVTISPDGKITDANTAMEAVTGRDRKDLIGNDFSSFFTEPEKVRNGYRQVFREGAVQDYHLEIRHRYGHVTSVLYNASVYRDHTGQVVGIFAAARDITAWKKAEDELRRSKHFIQRINDMLPDVLCLFDVVEQRYVYANRQAEPLLGYTPEQMKERGAAFVREVLHPEDMHILVELGEQVRTLKDGEIVEKEYRIKHGLSGEYRWLRSLAVVFERTLDGLPRLVLGIARDVTSNKITDEDLGAAEWVFREFAENAGALFWISTPGFDKFLYISPAYEQIWQRSCESIIDNAGLWFESVHPEDRPHVYEVMKTNPERGFTVEFRITRPDGSVRWIRNWAFPLGKVNGRVLRMGGMAEDITEEKRLEQETEYRRQQIIHADKLSALGEVVAGVAHEINNPNSFITYNIPLLDQTWKIIEPIVLKYAQAHPEWSGSELSLDELCQDMTGIIHDIQVGADRINRIVKDLKDFARLEESGHARPVQVNDVIRKTMTIVGAQVKKHAVKIVTELAEDLPEIEGHFNKLEQVVANLLVNAAHAVKGRDDGKILISTRYIGRLDAVIVTVEDNGSGITRDTMNRIFEPFFTTRRSEGGTGLGLSVSYGLIEEHKGTIGILSKPGVGSRFTVFLPVDCNKKLELKPTILYVDDDSVFLGLLRMHFISVHQCAEGLQSSDNVMAYLADHPEVDIVFSDLMMPNLNGWDLLAMVKEKFPLLTIVLYSGDLIALKARREHVPPPDYLIEKPFTMKFVAEIISRIGRQKL